MTSWLVLGVAVLTFLTALLAFVTGIRNARKLDVHGGALSQIQVNVNGRLDSTGPGRRADPPGPGPRRHPPARAILTGHQSRPAASACRAAGTPASLKIRSASGFRRAAVSAAAPPGTDLTRTARPAGSTPSTWTRRPTSTTMLRDWFGAIRRSLRSPDGPPYHLSQ